MAQHSYTYHAPTTIGTADPAAERAGASILRALRGSRGTPLPWALLCSRAYVDPADPATLRALRLLRGRMVYASGGDIRSRGWELVR